MKIKAIIAGLLVVLYFADNCDVFSSPTPPAVAKLSMLHLPPLSSPAVVKLAMLHLPPLTSPAVVKLAEGQFKSEKYVKNCTGYADKPEEEIYCGIFETKSRGTTRSFIRDCSDGKNFFDDSLNVQFENRILGDNQTTCVYKGTSDIVCITLCTGKGNDFCNGPLLSSASQEGLTKMFLLWISMLSVCASLFK
ncbi:hypothetical protein MAR_005123 [Mya arenaria]|uniref:Uncharacterized protein n=1 Tax=Mya arenaria TaxID=6604 RepID=A0ABY7EYL0_MYAAR|nr:hypothetical protein MAR_005123 [Mya arenaria]